MQKRFGHGTGHSHLEKRPEDLAFDKVAVSGVKIGVIDCRSHQSLQFLRKFTTSLTTFDVTT
jgi:hypothetical protein